MTEEGQQSIGVLGGGVAGILTAYELARHGHAATLYEARPVLGGLHQSHTADGAVFDVGTFTFDPRHEYFRVFPGIDAHFKTVDHTNSTLTPSLTLDAYPLSLRGYRRDHGSMSLLADLARLLTSKWNSRRRSDLIEFIHYYVGPGIYRRSGLKHYIERLYGLPDTEIDLEFARKRLGVIAEQCSLRANAWKLLWRALRDDREFPWRCRVRDQKGFETPYQFISDRLRDSGVDLQLGVTLERLTRRHDGFDVWLSGQVRKHDRIVSTIPMETVATLLGVTLPWAPTYKSLVSLFYRLDSEPGFTTHCLYNFSLDGPWKRMTLFSRYYGLSREQHYFAVECTVDPGTTTTSEELAREFEAHAARTSLLRGRLTQVGFAITPNAYPVYRRGDSGNIAACRAILEDQGLQLQGRQGRFDYISSKDLARQSRDQARP